MDMRTYRERTERIRAKAKVLRAKKARLIAISSAACLLAAIVTFNLVLFVPYSVGGVNIAKYADSEYYPLIRTLSGLTYNKYNTNNFEEWFGGMFALGGAPGKDVMESPAAGEGDGDGQNYAEVTNNQVAGVVEGDLFKRSDRYIYYLDYVSPRIEIQVDSNGKEYKAQIPESFVLRVYPISGADPALVAEYSIFPEEGSSFAVDGGAQREMYLSEDCNTVTLLTPCYTTDGWDRAVYTEIIGIDVSDVENITEAGRVYVSGSYISSRKTGDKILLFSSFQVRYMPDFSDESQFLPRTGSLGNMTSLPMDDIVCPVDASSASYAIACLIDETSLSVTDCVALLSYSTDVYVSADDLYVYRTVAAQERIGTESEGKQLTFYSATEICRVSYSEETLGLAGTFVVKGQVNDRYSMDAYDGVFRIFTTVSSDTIYDYTYRDGTYEYSSFSVEATSASLYCIDLSDLSVLASVERFAPDGEKVMSARFYGEKAYVCTAEIRYEVIVDINDPVYAFDLSDYTDISYTDTGTIPGYSLSLIGFGENLLGIGYGDDFDTLKVSLYRETGEEVAVIYDYLSENTSFSSEFKAYMIDAENGLIGLGISRYWEGQYFFGYLLLRCEEDTLSAVRFIPLEGSFDEMRAVYIDGYLYLFGTTNGNDSAGFVLLDLSEL